MSEDEAEEEEEQEKVDEEQEAKEEKQDAKEERNDKHDYFSFGDPPCAPLPPNNYARRRPVREAGREVFAPLLSALAPLAAYLRSFHFPLPFLLPAFPRGPLPDLPRPLPCPP